MSATFDFDQLLGSVLEAGGPQSVRPIVVDAALTQVRTVRQRRPIVRALDRRAWPAPRLSPANPVAARIAAVAVVALLALAVVAAAVAVGAYLNHRDPLLGRFTATGPMRVDRSLGPVAALLQDGRVLVVGGVDDGSPGLLSGDLYDPRTNTFGATTGSTSDDRTASSMTTLRDGDVLVAGGHRGDPNGPGTALASVERFHPETGMFQVGRQMNVGRENHTATLLDDGRVLVAGGTVELQQGPTAIVSVEVYDPNTGTWTQVGALADARVGHTATLLPDGRVLVTGGTYSMVDGSPKYLASAEVFDPATGRFGSTGQMTTARTGHTATLLRDGRVLIIGGRTLDPKSGQEEALSSAELYDPATGRFSTTGSLATARSGHTATLLSDGRVLVAGGGNDYGGALSTEVYDPESERFEPAAWSPGESYGPAISLSDGRVLFLGGSLEVFDPSLTTPVPVPSARTDRRFVATGDPLQDRDGHTATRLLDGRVLIAGGGAPPFGQSLASAEIFDPKTATFSATGSMAHDRGGHSAFLLADGRVLVIGGDGSATAPPEVYDPRTGLFTTPTSDGYAWDRIVRSVQSPDGRILLFGPRLTDQVTAVELDGDRLKTTVLGYSNSCGQVPTVAALPDGRVLVRCSGDPNDSFSIFDPHAGPAWQPPLPLPAIDSGDQMLSLPDGRVLFYGGSGSTLDVLDPGTGTMNTSGTLPPSKVDYVATLLGDGRVLLVGSQALIWDPGTDELTAASEPLTALESETVTLLDDGHVLVVGGTQWPADSGVPHPPGAELFDPGAGP